MLHSTIDARIREKEQSQSSENKVFFEVIKNRFKEIKEGEKQSHDMVNRHYLIVNKESLNSYKNNISHENQMSNEYTLEIKKLQASIDKFDRMIDKKKGKLLNIASEI